MSSAATTPHGLVTVRGRGYRPAQVDAFLEVLSQERDAAWERAARLTVLAKEMEAELARLGETVAALPPQTYESLGDQARRLYQLVLREAAEIRERARREAADQVARAEARALVVRREAREAADALRADAEERAVEHVRAAHAEAEDIRVSTRREVKAGRGAALDALREVRQRTTRLLPEQDREQAERWAAQEREETERLAAFEAWYAEAVTRAETALAQAERTLAETGESARRCQEEARAHAAELVAAARLHEERVTLETEQVLREHGETWDDVQAHMDSVRDSLISLTGRATFD
ncbi:cellulose-binding protein [Streptomyces bungoensis]